MALEQPQRLVVRPSAPRRAAYRPAKRRLTSEMSLRCHCDGHQRCLSDVNGDHGDEYAGYHACNSLAASGRCLGNCRAEDDHHAATRGQTRHAETRDQRALASAPIWTAVRPAAHRPRRLRRDRRRGRRLTRGLVAARRTGFQR